jgi:hypothetical protein
MIQKGGNYMFLHTYTFTIDIVLLVLEDQCFVGHIQEYGGIIVKVRHQKNITQIRSKEIEERPMYLANLDQAPMW